MAMELFGTSFAWVRPLLGLLSAFIIGFIVLAIFGGLFWFWWANKKYNKTVRIWEIVADKPVLKFSTKAKFVRIDPDSLEVWLKAKKLKQNLSQTVYKQAVEGAKRFNNEYWFILTPNNDLINFDMKFKNGLLEVDELEKEMAMSKVTQSKLMKKRYTYLTVLEQFKGLIGTVIILLVVIIGAILIFNAQAKVMKEIAGVQTASAGTVEKVNVLLDKAAIVLGETHGGSGGAQLVEVPKGEVLS